MSSGEESSLRDPVCGMSVTSESLHRYDFEGQGYSFCCSGCAEKFAADPVKYLNRDTEADQTPAATIFTCPMDPEVEQVGPGSCPKCGMALEPKTLALRDQDDSELRNMSRRFLFAALFSLPLVTMVSARYASGTADLYALARAITGLRRVGAGDPGLSMVGVALLCSSLPLLPDSESQYV